jgi:hypothetical protein
MNTRGYFKATNVIHDLPTETISLGMEGPANKTKGKEEVPYGGPGTYLFLPIVPVLQRAIAPTMCFSKRRYRSLEGTAYHNRTT